MAKKKGELAETRKTALEALAKELEKDGITLMPMSEQPVLVLDRISTGSLRLDHALGGGIPKGRIIEVYGTEGGGKTSVTLATIAQCQRAGGLAAFVDAEHTFDKDWAKLHGVDTDALWLGQPDSGEEGITMAVKAVTSGAFDLVVVDSVAALIPRAELEGNVGDAHVGQQARLMGQACRKLSPAAAKHNCAVVFINQLRMKIGVMFGNPETTPGGRALPYTASIRIDVRRGDPIKDKDVQIGNLVRIKIPKNKTAPPYTSAVLHLYYDKGFDVAGEVLDLAVELGFVEKSGAWYSYGKERIGQGKEAAASWLREHSDGLTELKDKVVRVLTTGEV